MHVYTHKLANEKKYYIILIDMIKISHLDCNRITSTQCSPQIIDDTKLLIVYNTFE